MILPDVWGEGALFAYSGLEGPTPYTRSLVGHLSGDRIGVVFPRFGLHSLLFRLEGHSDLVHEAVASDFLLLRVKGGPDRAWKELFLGFVACDALAGRTSTLAMPYLSSDRPDSLRRDGETTLCGGPGGWFALVVRTLAPNDVRFALAMDADDAAEAARKAGRALERDPGALKEEKLAWFDRLPAPPAGLGDAEARTLAKCFSIMKSQVCSPEGVFRKRWTTPDRLPHAMCWLWDSVFHSFGLRHVDPALARDALDAVFDMQRPDGCVPISVDPTNSPFVETQPPVLAMGVWEHYRATGDRSLVEARYADLARYLAWNRAHRDADGDHLYSWLMRENPNATNRCGESGMDNTPRFDDGEAKAAVDFSCFMARECEAMADMARLLGRAEEAAAWDAERRAIADAVNATLWDEADGFYYDRRFSDGALYKVKAVSGFLPLYAGICDGRRTAALVAHLVDPQQFGTDAPIPSVSLDDPTHEEDMWRGPSLINSAWLVIQGLRRSGRADVAADLRRKLLAAVSFWYLQDGIVFEFFHSGNRISPARLPRKGDPIQPYFAHPRIAPVRDFGWSATLFAALAMEPEAAADSAVVAAGSAGSER